MAYIETHQSMPTHRKTLRLARLLHMDRFAVVGRLVALWGWALDNAQDGVILKVDSDILADIMGWEADPADLCAALVTAGFLDEAEERYAIHDWWEYAGKLIEKRRADAERKRQERARAGQPKSVQRTSVGHPVDVAGNVPYPTLPNPTEPESSLSNEIVSKERERGDPLARTRAVAREKASPQKVAQKPEPTPATIPKPINPLWDVLVEVFWPPTTKDERSLFGKVVKELREIGATPDDIRERVKQHQRTQSHWDLTPKALVTHWSQLGSTANNGKNGTGSGSNGHYGTDQRPPEAETAEETEERRRLKAERDAIADKYAPVVQRGAIRRIPADVSSGVR